MGDRSGGATGPDRCCWPDEYCDGWREDGGGCTGRDGAGVAPERTPLWTPGGGGGGGALVVTPLVLFTLLVLAAVLVAAALGPPGGAVPLAPAVAGAPSGRTAFLSRRGMKNILRIKPCKFHVWFGNVVFVLEHIDRLSTAACARACDHHTALRPPSLTG